MFVPGNVGKSIYSWYQLMWTGLDWLYPPLCGGCGSSGSRWCLDCRKTIQLVPSSICKCCGKVLESEGICISCQESPPPFVALRAWAVFHGALRNALHRLKYEGDIALAEILAKPLLNMLRDLNWEIDLITAVPIGVARGKKRGYNQAALLALPLALGSGTTYQSRALLKIRETRSQVGLSRIKRHENVYQAFYAQDSLVSGKSVLVVDDVTTSGATQEACAQALVQAGARQVYGLTLARTVFDSVDQT